MAEPFVHWQADQLRLVGLSLAFAGCSIAMMIPLSKAGFGPRERFVLATAVGLSSYYSLDRFPRLTVAVTVLSASLAVVVPLVLSAKVVHDTIPT